MLQQHKLSARRADLVLASFALVYFAQLLTLDAHFDRYVLPLVPVLGALAGRIRPLVPVALALLVVPLVWSIGEVRELTRTDTRLEAHAWIEEHVPRDAPRRGRSLDAARRRRGRRSSSSCPARAARPTPIATSTRSGPAASSSSLVTGAVADRVLAAPTSTREEAKLYRELESRTTRAFRVDPGGELVGPWVAVYRI